MIETEEIDDMLREIKKIDKEGRARTLDHFQTEENLVRKFDERKTAVFKAKNLRADGRPLDTHRDMFIQLGTVSQARGSCYIEQGETKVIVSVRGPKEIPNIKEYTELCVIECIVEYAPFCQSTDDECFLGEAIRLSLEPILCRREFPNLQITVNAFILEDDGSALSAAITGASLALTHARLPTFGILTSVTLALHNGLALIDPSKEEENFCSIPFDENQVQEYGLITMAYESSLDQITLYQQSGSIDFSVYSRTLKVLTDKCASLRHLCCQHLMKELKISLKQIVDDQNVTEGLKKVSVK